MTSTDSFVAAANQLMDRFAKKSAAERRAYWVGLGMVNKEGRLTKAYGGEVDADASSIEAAAAVLDDPMDRLVWISRRGNDQLCLDGPTARRLVGAADIRALTELLKKAINSGFIERWWHRSVEPSSLDPEKDRDAVVGIRLTAKGMERASALEAIHTPDLPIEAIRR
jgi:hypothetical protein